MISKRHSFLMFEAAILHWYGSKEKFAAYVRGPLAFELLTRLSNNHVMMAGYVLIVLSAPVAAGLELCMSLWIGGAPWEVLLARFIGMVVGTEFLFCAMILMVAMNLFRSLGQTLLWLCVASCTSDDFDLVYLCRHVCSRKCPRNGSQFSHVVDFHSLRAGMLLRSLHH